MLDDSRYAMVTDEQAAVTTITITYDGDPIVSFHAESGEPAVVAVHTPSPMALRDAQIAQRALNMLIAAAESARDELEREPPQ